MTTNDTGSKLQIISHRCLGFGHPENSLKALQAVLKSGIDGIEFDVRLTKDHKWVSIHNPFFRSEEMVVHRVHEHNLKQIRREVVPLDTMLAVFAALGPEKEILIDVKDVGEERQIIRLLRRYNLQERAIVIAWEPEILRRVKEIDQKIRTGLSYVPLHSSMTALQGSINRPMSRHKVLMRFNALQSFDAKFKSGVTHWHYLSIVPDMDLYSIQVPSVLCTTKLVRLAHAKGIKVFPFGVRNTIGAALLRRQGIDGFMTDLPLRFLPKH